LIFTRKLYTVISRNIIEIKLFRLARAVDARLLSHLSRLSLNGMNKISFYRIIGILLSVFAQLKHLSLKLDIDAKMPDSLVISGDIIQRVCIDRLNPLATFTLNI
jgi:hypothetical protein